MLDVHGRLRRLAAQSDPLARVADDLAEDIKVHDAAHTARRATSIIGQETHAVLHAVQDMAVVVGSAGRCSISTSIHVN